MLNSKLKFENKNKMAESISRKKCYRNDKSFSIFLRNVVLENFLESLILNSNTKLENSK